MNNRELHQLAFNSILRTNVIVKLIHDRILYVANTGLLIMIQKFIIENDLPMSLIENPNLTIIVGLPNGEQFRRQISEKAGVVERRSIDVLWRVSSCSISLDE